MSEQPLVKAEVGSNLGLTIIVSGGCYCMYLGVMNPWAMVQLLGAMFGFGVAAMLFIFGFIKLVDKWG